MQVLSSKGNGLISNWLCLLLSNLLLIGLFTLIIAAIMLATNPPGKIVLINTRSFISFLGIANTVTASPLKMNQLYNASCFTFDSSCDVSKKLWCVDSRCQCCRSDDLLEWNFVYPLSNDILLQWLFPAFVHTHSISISKQVPIPVVSTIY